MGQQPTVEDDTSDTDTDVSTEETATIISNANLETEAIKTTEGGVVYPYSITAVQQPQEEEEESNENEEGSEGNSGESSDEEQINNVTTTNTVPGNVTTNSYVLSTQNTQSINGIVTKSQTTTINPQPPVTSTTYETSNQDTTNQTTTNDVADNESEEGEEGGEEEGETETVNENKTEVIETGLINKILDKDIPTIPSDLQRIEFIFNVEQNFVPRVGENIVQPNDKTITYGRDTLMNFITIIKKAKGDGSRIEESLFNYSYIPSLHRSEIKRILTYIYALEFPGIDDNSVEMESAIYSCVLRKMVSGYSIKKMINGKNGIEYRVNTPCLNRFLYYTEIRGFFKYINNLNSNDYIYINDYGKNQFQAIVDNAKAIYNNPNISNVENSSDLRVGLLFLQHPKTERRYLSDFLTSNELSEENSLGLLFQLVWTLYCFNKIGLQHNNLHLGSIYVDTLKQRKCYKFTMPVMVEVIDEDTGIVRRVETNQSFYVKTFYRLVIAGFYRATVHGKLTNTFVKNELCVNNPHYCDDTELIPIVGGVKAITNPGHDLFQFMCLMESYLLKHEVDTKNKKIYDVIRMKFDQIRDNALTSAGKPFNPMELNKIMENSSQYCIPNSNLASKTYILFDYPSILSTFVNFTEPTEFSGVSESFDLPDENFMDEPLKTIADKFPRLLKVNQQTVEISNVDNY
jgi:hypothetical protein